MAYLAKKKLKDLGPEDFEEILALYEVEWEQLLGYRTRKEPIPEARNACMYALCECGLNHHEAGKIFYRDAPIVWNAIRRIKGFIDAYPKDYAPLVEAVEKFKSRYQRK